MTPSDPTRRGGAVLALVVAALAELCALALLGVSGWYLAACALAGAGLWMSFSYPAPSGVVRLLALGRIGARYGQNLLLHRAALAATTRIRLELYDALSEEGALKTRKDRVDALLDDSRERGERIVRVTAPIVTSAAAALVAIIVVAAAAPLAALWLAGASIAIAAVATTARGYSAPVTTARADLATDLEAAAELSSLGAADMVVERVVAKLAEVEVNDRRESWTEIRRRGVLVLLAGIGFTGAIVCSAATLFAAGPSTSNVPVFILHVCVIFAVLDRINSFGDIVSAMVRARTNRNAVHAAEPIRTYEDVRVTQERGVVTDRLGAIAPGSFVAIYGPSGVGKTTMLTSLYAAFNETEDSARVAFVHDDEFLFTGTVASNLRLGDPHVAEAHINEYCAALGLEENVRADTKVGVGGRQLSHGETRRLIILRAVLSNPDVLLIDEPALGLDAATLSIVLAFIREHRPHATIIVSAHAPLAGVERSIRLT